MNKNIKLKENYYINKKTHLVTETFFVLHHSLKINKRGGEGGRKKIEKLTSVHPFIRYLKAASILSKSLWSFCLFIAKNGQRKKKWPVVSVSETQS